MNTHATIRIKRIDGTETGIYCHWEGYIDVVGITLQLAYNTAEKVENLLKLGDISVLRYYTEPQNKKQHNFNHPQENVCVAYHRDRGDAFRQSNEQTDFIYTFDENEACWFIEEKRHIEKSPAIEHLKLCYFSRYEKNILLDRILSCDIEDRWTDDEFAKAGEVKEACINKAKQARKERIKEKDAMEAAYQRAFYKNT